jgi:hypothetical protein
MESRQCHGQCKIASKSPFLGTRQVTAASGFVCYCGWVRVCRADWLARTRPSCKRSESSSWATAHIAVCEPAHLHLRLVFRKVLALSLGGEVSGYRHLGIVVFNFPFAVIDFTSLSLFASFYFAAVIVDSVLPSGCILKCFRSGSGAQLCDVFAIMAITLRSQLCTALCKKMAN